MLTNRALLVVDVKQEYFIAFAPEFDCEGTAERLGALISLPGHRQASSRIPCASCSVAQRMRRPKAS